MIVGEVEEVIAKQRRVVTDPVVTTTKRRNFWRSSLGIMTSSDLIAVAFIAFLAVLGFVAAFRLSTWWMLELNCALLLLGIFLINYVRSRRNEAKIRVLHIFYVAPLVPLVFKSVEFLSYPLHGRDYDAILIAADRMLLGADPTVWLSTHLPTMPAFIEYLQLCYSSFYFLPVILGIELYRRRKARKTEYEDLVRDELEEMRYVIVYAFFLSYVGYIALPAVGPRWTLHDFFAIDRELPGLWLTSTIRHVLNAGENVKDYMTAATARAVVTRDAFPSGHVDVTFVVTLLAFKYRAHVRWVLGAICLSMIFATVYLRYHYVIDVVGGLLFAVLTLYTCFPLERLLLKIKSKLLAR